jgi:hypothetical protein
MQNGSPSFFTHEHRLLGTAEQSVCVFAALHVLGGWQRAPRTVQVHAVLPAS